MRLDRLLDQLTGTHLLLGIVWLGMVFVTAALLTMMITRWGQSQPLKKCVFLSLLTHALLATYATTVEIVAAAPIERFVRASIVDSEPTDGNAGPGEKGVAVGSAVKPWEGFANNPPPEERAQLPRPELTPSPNSLANGPKVSAVLPSELPDMPLPDADLTSPEPTSLVDAEPISPTDAAAEEPIEAPAATRRVARDPALTERMGPAKAKATGSSDIPAFSGPTPGLPGELSSVPSLPRMADFPAARPGPVSSNSSGDPDARSDTPLAAESLADSGGRGRGSERHGEAGIGSIVAREARRSTGAPASMTAPTRPDMIGNPLLVPRKPATEEPPEPPRVYENRRSANKGEIIAAQGGSPAAESAVNAALQWLADNQDTDGRWDASNFGAGKDRAVVGMNLRNVGSEADNGVTGLALLAFLGNGQTHLEGDYHDTVERGLGFLLSTQKSSGEMSGSADHYARMYCHGMAALAVSEAYAMTHDERLLSPVRKAINYTLAAQHRRSGGWRYKSGEEMCDTSQLGWQLMALKSAELAGIEIPAESRQGMLRFLKSVSSGRYGGLASYRPLTVSGERVTASMTAEALVCRQFLGLQRSNPACNEAGNFVLTDLPGQGRSNFYYWYYATLGMFQLQGNHWERWKNALEPTLISLQRTEGDLNGSWDPDPVWGGHGGRVYSTALGALCLEVYYRYLPIYGQAPDGGE